MSGRTLHGVRGAISAGHPLAVGAGLHLLAVGGNAVDAAIAAQSVLCVVMPNACGLGGDTLLMVRTPDGNVTALNGCGASARNARTAAEDGGNSVTVPGIVRAWEDMHRRWGGVPWRLVLQQAIELAERGIRVGPQLALGDASAAGKAPTWRGRKLAPSAREPGESGLSAGARRSPALNRKRWSGRVLSGSDRPGHRCRR